MNSLKNKKRGLSMSSLLIIEILRAYFDMEIENKVCFNENEILVELLDGTKARIRAKNIA